MTKNSKRPKLITKLKVITLVALILITIISQWSSFRFDWMLYADGVYGEPVVLEPREQGLSGAHVYEVLTHPKDVQKLIARSKTGNYLSLDRGEHWALITMGDVDKERYEEFPIKWDPDGSLVALRHHDLHRSPNGTQWTRIFTNQWEEDLGAPTSVSAKTEIKINGRALQGMLTRDLEGGAWVGTTRGVYYQPKGASTWSERNQGIHRPIITTLRMHPRDTRRVLALAKDGRVWLSDDFGSSWALIYEGDAVMVRFGRSEERDVLIVNRDKSIVSRARGGETEVLLSPSEHMRLSCEDIRGEFISTRSRIQVRFQTKELIKKLDCTHRLPPSQDLKKWENIRDQDKQELIIARYWLSWGYENYTKYREPCDVGQNQDGTLWFYLCAPVERDHQQVYLFKDQQWSPASLDQVEAESIRFHRIDERASKGNLIKYRREQISADCELALERDDNDYSVMWLRSTQDQKQRSQMDALSSHFDLSHTDPFTWLNDQTFTILGGDGLQVGAVSEGCQPDLSVVWSWTYRHRENSVRYHHFNRKIARWRLSDDEISLLLPGDDGGLWGLKVPKTPPLSINRVLKRLDEVGFVWWLWGVLLLYGGVTLRRRRAVTDVDTDTDDQEA